MVWLLLAVLLIVIFGLGTVLEAAFWLLLLIAGVVVLAFVAVVRMLA